MSATNIQKPIYHYAFRLKKGEEGDVSPLHEDFKKAYFAFHGTNPKIFLISNYLENIEGEGLAEEGLSYSYGATHDVVFFNSADTETFGRENYRIEFPSGNSETHNISYEPAIIALLENPLENNYYFVPFYAELYSVNPDGGARQIQELFYFAAKFSFKKEDIKSYLIENKVRRFAAIGFNLPEDKSEFENYDKFFETLIKNPNNAVASRYSHEWSYNPNGSFDEEYTETNPDSLTGLNYTPSKTLKISDCLSAQGRVLEQNQIISYSFAYSGAFPPSDAMYKLPGYKKPN